MDILNLFDILDLNNVALKSVKEKLMQGSNTDALQCFFDYFMKKKHINIYSYDDVSLKEEYCRSNCKQDIEEVISVANQVRNQNFVFRYKWDMEKTNEPVLFKEEINWEYKPYDDNEWTFMLNRHKYWIALGQAYCFTKNEEYAKAFFSQMEHWIDNNARTQKSQSTTWRTIEAGIRCENWIKSFMYFRNSSECTPERLAKFILSLNEHGKYLNSIHDGFRRLSNWGVIGNHGLFMLAVFLPELKMADEFRKNSINRLNEEIKLQIMKDGMHWEQSPMYHNEVLHCYLDIINAAERNNIQLPKEILEKTKSMVYADLYMAQPNHYQPVQSDSDYTDLRDILTKAAYIYSDGVLKFGAYRELDFDNVWDLELEAIEKYKSLKVLVPECTDYAFKDSGNYFLRSGWSEEDNYLRFHCGTIGSGHGHADLLHIDIFAQGESMLVDPGRYNYCESSPVRAQLKDCSSHNTTIIDNKPFTECTGSWSYSKIATPIQGSYISEEDYAFVEGSHLGYMDLESPVFTLRKVIFIKPAYWIIIDEFHTTGEHNYKQLFHFDNKGKVLKEGKLVTYQGEKAKLNIFALTAGTQYKIENCSISKEYNKLEESNKLIVEKHNKGFTAMITVLNAEKNKENNIASCELIELKSSLGDVLNKDEASGIKITLQNGEIHIIVVLHKEIHRTYSLIDADGEYVYGKVVLIKRNSNENKVYNIKY